MVDDRRRPGIAGYVPFAQVAPRGSGGRAHAATVMWRAGPSNGDQPEQEALLADSVGAALLVVLDRLSPAERLAFVLHDTFAVPFDEIAVIAGCTPAAARLASRARRRVQGAPTERGGDVVRQRELVAAFLAAARAGDFDAPLTMLDPEVVLRVDETAAQFPRSAQDARGAVREIRGAAAIASRAVGGGGAGGATLALVNGAVGGVLAPLGRLLLVLRFTIARGKIIAIEAIANPQQLRQFEITLLDA